MENKKYKYKLKKLEHSNNIQENINLRTQFIKKMKTKYPSIRMTFFTWDKMNISPASIQINQISLIEGGEKEPTGLYYNKNYNRCELIPNKKKEIKFKSKFQYLYGFKLKNRKIYTTIDKKNPNLILVIRNKNDCDKFWELYGIDKKKKSRKRDNPSPDNKKNTKIVPSYRFDSSYFDFDTASEDFAGLEFKYTCGYGYFEEDADGVIWNTNIIKELVQMYPEK